MSSTVDTRSPGSMSHTNGKSHMLPVNGTPTGAGAGNGAAAGNGTTTTTMATTNSGLTANGSGEEGNGDGKVEDCRSLIVIICQ